MTESKGITPAAARDLSPFERAQARFASTWRVIRAALTLGTFDDWSGVVIVLRARLSAAERASLAWAVMRSLDTHQRGAVSEALGVFETDAPLPPLDVETLGSDAGMWATAASEETLVAFALAAFRAMDPANQRKFMAYIAQAAA